MKQIYYFLSFNTISSANISVPFVVEVLHQVAYEDIQFKTII